MECTECIKHKHHPRSEEELKTLKNRLHRMIGQLSGIENMLDENRYCGDILIQVAAIEKALQSFGYLLLESHINTCVVEEIRQGNMENLSELMKLIKKLK